MNTTVPDTTTDLIERLRQCALDPGCASYEAANTSLFDDLADMLENGAVIRAGTMPSDHLAAARPDWMHVYRGVAHIPDHKENDLIPVTRETLRLAMHALQKQNAEDYYHNYGAAANELYVVLGATEQSPPTPKSPRNDGDQPFFNMLWNWFDERGALTHSEARNGMTPEDFKTMLDEHEAALIPTANHVSKLKEEIRARVEDDWARKNEPRPRRYALQTPSGNIVGMGTEKPQLSRQDKRMGWRVIALGPR